MGWGYTSQYGKMSRDELKAYIESEYTYRTEDGRENTVIESRVSATKAHLICKLEGEHTEYWGATILIDNRSNEIGTKPIGVENDYPVAMARKLVALNGENWEGFEAKRTKAVLDYHESKKTLRTALRNLMVGQSITLKNYQGEQRTYTRFPQGAITRLAYKSNDGLYYYTPQPILERDWELV